MALPTLSPFAPCPSCGGWARRPAVPRETRARCRGCGWRGALDPPPARMGAMPRVSSAQRAPRLDASLAGPAVPPWRAAEVRS